ncbi:MAG: hypothetical protein U0835_17955 [Isosphaeraceae bacterium]
MNRMSAVLVGLVFLTSCPGRADAQTVRFGQATLQQLLAGDSLRVGGLSFENFRGLSAPDFSFYGAVFPSPTVIDPASVLVRDVATGVEFTGLGGGALVSTAGQIARGARFTFDVRAVNGPPLDLARLGMSGSAVDVAQVFPGVPIFPQFQLLASLTGPGVTPPLDLILAAQKASGSVPMSTSAPFSPASVLTFTEQFGVVGFTVRGTNTVSTLNSVSVSVVPEPSPLVLASAAIGAIAAAAWRRRLTRRPRGDA